jgi:hypothetical protein
MGYRGRLEAQEEARRLRATGATLQQIADEVGAARSSVAAWVRGVPVDHSRGRARDRPPNVLARRKQEEVVRLVEEGRRRVGRLDDRDLLIAGIALYAGEGAKTDGSIKFTNSDPAMMRLFMTWLRRFFEIDETRLRLRIYLHAGLDLAAAEAHWASVTSIPTHQFHAPYRAEADPTRRHNKHEYGCATVHYGSATGHRTVMGLVGALLSCDAIPG